MSGLSCHDHGNCELCDQIEAERDRLQKELEEMYLSMDSWRSRAEVMKEALEKIGYAQGNGHPLVLMKVAREVLAEAFPKVEEK